MTAVDRLRLRVPWADGGEAGRLARLVAERLAPPLALAGGAGVVERLRVEVAAAPGEDAESLAGRIAAEVERELLRRSLEVVR